MTNFIFSQKDQREKKERDISQSFYRQTNLNCVQIKCSSFLKSKIEHSFFFIQGRGIFIALKSANLSIT